MSAYSLTLKTSKAHLPVYVLTCPPEHGDGMIKYLRHHQCKFHRVMERRCWDRYHKIDRDVFYIEVAPDKVIESLVKSTQAKGGKVDINQVGYNIVNRKDNSFRYLNVTFKGQCIQYMCCERADDFYNHNVFNATFTENDLLDIKAAIFTAVERSQGTLTVGYDTRICLDIAELFVEYGFVSVPEDECLVLKR